MHGNLRIFLYTIFFLLIISSIVLAMPGAFSGFKGNSSTSTAGVPLAEHDYPLKIGATKTIQGIQFTFARVESDNRCPPDIQCLTTGRAEVTIKITESGAAEYIRVGTDSPAVLGAYSLHLISLTPIPATVSSNAEIVLRIEETSLL